MAIVPIADQVSEVEREIGLRHRVYPAWIASGRISQHEAELRIETLGAALATLRLVQQYADGVRKLILFLRAANLEPGETPTTEERDALLTNPAVRELVRTFPGAEIVAVRPAPPITPPDLFDHEEGTAL